MTDEVASFRARIEELEKQLAAEHADMNMIVDNVSQVYAHVTDNLYSKPTYLASALISKIDEIRREELDREVKEETAELQEQVDDLEATVQRVKDAVALLRKRGDNFRDLGDNFLAEEAWVAAAGVEAAIYPPREKNCWDPRAQGLVEGKKT